MMKVRDVRAALETVQDEVEVVLCLNPGPGSVATPATMIMETNLNVTRDGHTALEPVIVIIGAP